ncbi:MAG: GGDEF domain-containing protein [Candidatus Methylumidiphilus sp.]
MANPKTTLLISRTALDEPCGQSYLVVVKGGPVGKKFTLSGSMLVGRAFDCEIWLDQQSVSRKHAQILLDETGIRLTVTDLSSLNGTFYRGTPIDSVELFDGDQIVFGEITCKFLTDINAEGSLLESVAVDYLTKAYNKRYFSETLNVEYEKSLQTGLPLTVLLIDIDHFKAINDMYGHPAGDAVLAQMAATVAGLIAPDMTFARTGGEEFAVLLPNTGKDQGIVLAEQIRATIAAQGFYYQDQPIPVTVSIGVRDNSSNIPLDEFLQQADALLYLAKHSGRNTVRG